MRSSRTAANAGWVRCASNCCIETNLRATKSEAAEIWNALPRRDDARPGVLLTAEPAIDARTLLAGMFKLGLMMRTDVDLSTQELNGVAVLLADDLLAELAKELVK